MERTIRISFIVLLLLICFSASVFMILESGSFFQKLYGNSSSSFHMGYWAAFLNEVFMGIMAGVWLPGKAKGDRQKVHPANILFKTLLVFLFFTTVFAASMNTVEPLILSVQQQRNENRLIEIAKEQVDENQKALKTFASQNQRVNSALSFRQQLQTREELKQLISSQKSTFVLWAEIVVILLIRFGVQMANLSCIWLVGWIYRQPLPAFSDQQEGTTEKKESIETLKTDLPPTVVHLHTKRAKPMETVKEKQTEKTKPITTTTTRSQQKTPVEPAYSRSVHRNPTPKRTVSHKPNVADSTDIRNRIVQLLNSRNDGITLSQIGEAIGEKESNLMKIVNPRSGFDQQHLPRLEGILSKIEKLYQEEALRAY